MHKFKLNFIIDALMFILMMGMAGQGFLLEYVLVPGQEIPAKYGVNADLYFFGLDRHEWGDIHLIMAYILLALLLLHIILHWKAICVFFQKSVLQPASRKIFAGVFVIFNLLLLTFFLIFKPELREFERGSGRGRNFSAVAGTKKEPFLETSAAKAEIAGSIERSQDKLVAGTQGRQSSDTIEHEKNIQDRRKITFPAMEKQSPESELAAETPVERGKRNRPSDSGEEQGHNKQLEMVRGMYTLGEVAETYSVPVAYITEKLGLPSGTSSLEKLGTLRKRYGFRMSDVERIILKYKEKAN